MKMIMIKIMPVQIIVISLITVGLLYLSGCGPGDDKKKDGDTTASIDDTDPLSADKAITAFSFEAALNSALSTDATGTISGTDISVTVPFATDVTALTATFSTEGTSVLVGSTEQTSGITTNDFSSPLNYEVLAADVTSQVYTVTVLSLDETTPPTANSSIANGSLINGSTEIIITFSESMAIASTVFGGTMAVESAAPIWSQVTNLNDQLTIRPNSVWSEGLDRTLTIDANDIAGNPLATLILNFTVDYPPNITTAPVFTENPNPAVPLAGILTLETDEATTVTAEISDGTYTNTITFNALNTSHTINLFGFRPALTHTIQVSVTDSMGQTTSSATSPQFEAPPLPTAFPEIIEHVVGSSSAEPGVTFINASASNNSDEPANLPTYLIIAVNNDGEVIWYVSLPASAGEVKLLANGNLLIGQGRTKIIEMDMLGNIVKTWISGLDPDSAAPGTAILVDTDTFHHDIIVMPNGNFLILSSAIRYVVDYPTSETTADPPAPAYIVEDLIVEFDPTDGAIVQQWSLMEDGPKDFPATVVDTASDQIAIFNHDFVNDSVIQFSTDDILPTPLNDTDDYYVTVVDSNTITLSATLGGATINLTDQGTGIHTAIPASGTEVTPIFPLLDPTRIGYGSLGGFWNSTYGRDDTYDWSHANGLAYDPNTNGIIVSLRHQDALIKFNYSTDQLIWIIGEHTKWNSTLIEFLLDPPDDTTTGFWQYHQHAPMVTSTGNVLLFDNGNYQALPTDPQTLAENNNSRAVEFKVTNIEDEYVPPVRFVDQVWEFKPADNLYAPFIGDADEQPITKNILVTFGGVNKDPASGDPSDSIGGPSAGKKFARIIEVTHDASPIIVFDIQIGNSDIGDGTGWTSFRSTKVPGLYPN